MAKKRPKNEPVVEEQAEPEAPLPVYEVVSVDRRAIHLLQRLFEGFVASGASQWDVPTLTHVVWSSLPNPGFIVWAVVVNETEPVGFAVVQLQPSQEGPQAWVLATFIEEGVPLAMGQMLNRAVATWARTLGAKELWARTKRIKDSGLAEPEAWARLGFSVESIILKSEVR